MTLVVDASVVVAALIDTGSMGEWAETQLANATDLAAPAILGAEVTNVLRRSEAAHLIESSQANLAFADLKRLRVLSVGFELIADRMWELRHNLTGYDASYVATAELLGATLATLDTRLISAPEAICDFVTP